MSEKISQLQTDGSFGSTYNISRTASMFLSPEKIEYSKVKTYLDHRNSYESEWCSVLDGIELAIEKNEYVLELENDNKAVIESLMRKKRPAKPYVVDYFDQILDISKKIDYLAVRWIPRELNKADKLFRI